MYKDKKGLWTQQITINGKRKVFRSKDKKELLLKIATYQDDVKHHTPKFRTVADAWEEQKRERISVGTWRSYAAPLKDVVEEFGDTEIGKITARDVQRYLNSLSMSYKSTTTRKQMISQVFNYAIVDLNIDISNPCDRVTVDTRLPKGHRNALTQEEIQAIKDTDKDSFILAPVIFYTGARVGEAMALQFQDIDFDKKIIHITKSIDHQGNRPVISTTKTSAGVRDVPLLPQLEALLPKKRKKTDYVVSGAEPLTKSALAKRWKKWCKEHEVSFDRHSIRHTYATMLYESGIDVKAAQRLLGHANFQTTMDVYTHLSDEHLKQAQEKLIEYLK